LTRESGADNEEEIVEADDDDGEQRASGATSTAGLRAERNSDESEDEAGDGKGKALVEYLLSLKKNYPLPEAPEATE